MKDNAKCFIKIGKGIFEEITYQELKKRQQTINTYKIKKFIPVQRMLLEVSDEEYKDFYRAVEQHKYQIKKEREVSFVYLSNIEEDKEIRDKQVIEDKNIDIEEEIERKLELEQLRKALMKLSVEDYKLIKALFYNEKTLREYAEIMGVSYVTIYHKKLRILKKLKKFLKN